MVRILEGWLGSMDDGWEVIHISSANSLNEKNEPCESSMKHEEYDDKIKETNESEVDGGSTRVLVDSGATSGRKIVPMRMDTIHPNAIVMRRMSISIKGFQNRLHIYVPCAAIAP